MTDFTATLAERGARYGKFEDHAVIAQGLKDQMWATEGWSRLAPDQRQALEVIQDKVARILNGDPDYTDNWHDIAGYSRLVEDRLTAAADATRFLEHCADVMSDAIKSDWIEWNGGECPVPKDALVDVRFRGGATDERSRAAIWFLETSRQRL